MRSLIVACALVAASAWACGGSTPASAAAQTSAAKPPAQAAGASAGAPAAGAVVTGIAFVDSSVTGMGGQAKLPAGTTIYPLGSKITGTTGCPTNRYGTDGQIVAVIDYQGRPTEASLQVREHPAAGGDFPRAPYYIDLNAGRTLQFLGPITGNGSYDLAFSYDYNLGKAKSSSGSFVLARTCPPVR